MKKSALMIPVGAATAALLLIAAAAKYRQAAHQPDPYAAISWLAAIIPDLDTHAPANAAR